MTSVRHLRRSRVPAGDAFPPGSVVVGVDRSPVSRLALERALQEGRSLGRPVRVLSTWMPPVWLGEVGVSLLPLGEDFALLAKALADKVLAEARLAVPETSQDRVTTEGYESEPGRALVDAAAGAALVVVGGHGHGPLVGGILGSATGYVLHHARCPVMVVPESTASEADCERVVVGTDGSPSSRGALAWAVEAAVRHGVPLLVLHARLLTTRPGTSDLPVLSEVEEDLVWLRTEVDQVPSIAGVGSLQLSVVRGGATAGLLAEAGPRDLLVLGSHGLGGFAGLLLGSVATQCSQHARGAVVVVRA